MKASHGTRLFALSLVLSCAACSAPEPADLDPGTSQEGWCQGFYVNHVVAHDGIVFFVSPAQLAVATEVWGPQTMSLSVDQGFSPEISYETTPGVSLEKDKITKSLEASVGFSLTTSTNLVASTAVAVPTGAYYRLEAYPEYQLVDFDVRRDPCGFMPDVVLASGSVYRPIGIHFRVMVYVSGAWNALAAPSPSELPLPPSMGGALAAAAAGQANAAGGADAGAGDGG